MRSTPTYVGEPECNSVMERWMRTLKEECLDSTTALTPLYVKTLLQAAWMIS